MVVAVTHAKVVTVPDDGTSPVGTDEWNAGHVITGLDDALALKLADPTNFEWSGVGGANNSTRTNRDRWSDHVELEEFKANGDGVTGDYSAMMRAHDYLKRNGANGPGGTIHLRYDKRYLMEATATFTRGVSVDGGFRNPGNLMDVAAHALHYDTQGGLLVPAGQTGLILDSSGSLTNTLVMRAGMTFPAADSSAFSGLAVQFAANSNGGLVESCMFLGLDRAILTTAGAQHRFKNLFIDCQNGISISSSLDVCWIDRVHCWPFLDDLLGTQAQQAVKAQRTGIGLLLSNGADWHKVSNFFTFTQNIGVKIDSCNSVTVQSSHDNNPLTSNPDQIGVLVSGTSADATVIPQAAGVKYGVVVQRTVDGGEHSRTTALIQAPRFWSTQLAGILNTCGNIVVRGPGFIRDTVDGIVDNDAGGLVSVSGIQPYRLSGSFYNLGAAKTTGYAKQFGNDLEPLGAVAPFGGAGAASGISGFNLPFGPMTLKNATAAATVAPVLRLDTQFGAFTTAVPTIDFTGNGLPTQITGRIGSLLNGDFSADLLFYGNVNWTSTPTESFRIVGATGAAVSKHPTGGIGYGAGAGGTVAQATSKATGVTLNRASGQITMNAAALAAGTIVSFVLTNTAIAATDVLILNHISGGTPGSYSLNARCAAGSATIDVRNNTAGSLSEAIVIQFALLKAVNA